MKKNDPQNEEKNENIDAVIVNQPITQTLEVNFMPYAMSVIVSRAIPEIDGFKPSHRKLLYTMYKMGLLNGKRTKSANVVGQTMKLNPHGDGAIYETLVRLTRANAALLHPYIDSKGNFGKHYSRDMAYAASRYTEVKLDSICEELFRGLDKDTVDFVDNYDGSTQEPTLFPTTFPSILVNSNQGIAVGMASQISSFNLEEVCKTTIKFLKNPDTNIIKYMPAPDFESGGQIIYNEKAISQIYETGRGSIKLRATYRIDKKNSMIEILEIPYVSTIEKIIEETTDLVKSGKIKEINDIRDESDKDGFKITIEYKKSADPKALIAKLFKFTELEKTFSCNFNILINGKPRVLGVKQILGEWISWRRSCVRREVAYDLQKNQERMHLLNGLEKILLDIDKAVKIIRETKLSAQVIPNLMEGFNIDEIQSDYVADIRLRNLNEQYILERTKDIASLKGQIKKLKEILGDNEKIDELITMQLNDVIKKYAKPRRSEIINEDETISIENVEIIEDYRLKLFLTEHGYLKKIPLTSLRSAGDIKTKEDDKFIHEIETTNKTEILFFSSKANVYKIKTYDLKDHKPSELGEFLTNLLSLEEGENIIFMLVTTDYKGKLLLSFENGKVAKIKVNNYETKTNRKKLKNAFSSKSEIISICYFEENSDYAIYSDIDKILIFNSKQIPLKTTRTNNGVQVMISKKASKVISLKKVSDTNIVDTEYYTNKRIPAVGYYIKENTLDSRQLSLDT